MRVKSKKVDLAEGDLTPMIDMTFQLIAFFMVLINFAQTESNDRVKLPSSQLVKPPEVPLEFPIILHVAQDGEIILGGDDYTAETLRVECRNRKTPFLLAAIISISPSAFISTALICLPTPESSSIKWGTNSTPP